MQQCSVHHGPPCRNALLWHHDGVSLTSTGRFVFPLVGSQLQLCRTARQYLRQHTQALLKLQPMTWQAPGAATNDCIIAGIARVTTAGASRYDIAGWTLNKIASGASANESGYNPRSAPKLRPSIVAKDSDKDEDECRENGQL
jgi:hypothetical protein